MSAAELRTIRYSGHLYRADPTKGDLNQNSPLRGRKRMESNRIAIAKTANKHYRTLKRKNNPQVQQQHHFFTMSDAEVSPYRQKGITYTKEWKADDLLLIDIMDLPTRQYLATLFSEADAKALDTAFPIINNIVYRKSDDETVVQDRAVIDAIGRLSPYHGQKIDGYYMKRQEAIIPSHTITPFHSEVGVCRHAFPKLRLVSTTIHEKIPNVPTKAHKPSLFKNNNNNHNNTKSSKRVKGALLLSNNNNNRNHTKQSKGSKGALNFNNVE